MLTTTVPDLDECPRALIRNDARDVALQDQDQDL
jgi:hypothetical protein